jgi:hypothetical protein
MKANELRIGNLYDNNGNYFVVTPSTIESVFENERVWCKPIPLTEEMLFNCGFSKNVGHYIVFGRYKDKTLEVAYNNDTNETQYYVYVRGLLDNEFVQLRHDLKYLHELQNLYFAITGNELSVSKT